MLDVLLRDGKGSGLSAHVHALTNSKAEHNGIIVLQERFLNFNSEVHPFLNSTFGVAMNQAVAPTGVDTIIHAGVNSGSAISGTNTSAGSSVLIDTGGGFDAVVGLGSSVENTTDSTYARVTSIVDDQNLALDADIFPVDTGDSYVINPIWTGNIIAGTWNFADSGKITITSANTNDTATFDTDTLRLWDMDKFASLTGKVDLDTYDPTQNSINMQFLLNGVAVGNSFDINDVIDAGDFAEQVFVVPKESFGLSSQNVNQLSITITRSGGVKPTIKFDDLHLVTTEGVQPLVYKATTPFGTLFHVAEIRISIADNITGLVTNGTMPGLSYDKILGLSALTNGITFNRTQDGDVKFSLPLKQLGDFLGAGSNLVSAISDGTNTHITLSVAFPEPFVLNGNENSFISFTINDDLSGLLEFKATARGAIEI